MILSHHQTVANELARVNFEGEVIAIFASLTLPYGHETTTEIIGCDGVINMGVGAHLVRNVLRNNKGVKSSGLSFYDFKYDF
jgi:myo-inositol 2-dehydrogenase/D-chiro-inositol 1-dehydrogenase